MTSSPGSVIEEFKTAVKQDDVAAVRELARRHPDLDARINEPSLCFGQPAICGARSAAMIDAMIDLGADLNAKSNWWAGGFGFLHTASPELAAHAIKRGATVDVHAAARLGLLDRLAALVEQDSTLVHARGGDGQTPLHFASSIDIAAYLLDHGAQIDALDVDHESTPAQYMTGDRNPIARYLVENGCKTDLLMATALSDISLVRSHLDNDPDCIRMRVTDEFFPMIGSHCGGTIYQWTLGFYVSAHQVASKNGDQEILSLLMERSPPEEQLIAACWIGDSALIQRLEPRRPEIVANLSAGNLRQPANAAHNNNTEAVRRLVQRGFPIDKPGRHGATPLHWAAFHGNVEMVNEILSKKPPLEVADADHHSTPLGWAIYGSENGWYAKTGDYAGTVTALLDAGARMPAEIGGTPSVRAMLEKRQGSAQP
jgi:ankyrin repeat protein